MSLKQLIALFVFLAVATVASAEEMLFMDDPVGRRTMRSRVFVVTIKNLTKGQPFSPFAVVAHMSNVPPLYRMGRPASRQLRILAEDGDPMPLVNYYNRKRGAKAAAAPGPLLPNGKLKFRVVTPYRYISFASMLVNTNDGFSGVSMKRLRKTMKFTLFAYDAGTEVNNELCKSVPGPACPMNSGNERSKNGEGKVMKHEGIKGVGDLSRRRYNWQGPVLAVRIRQKSS